jgi:SAM-dependent methyltransferase
MFLRIVERFRAVVETEGLPVAIAKVTATLRRLPMRGRTDSFDGTFHTETSAIVPLWRLKIPSSNAKFGTRYQTCDPSVFFSALRVVPEDPRELVFIDLGCGKGRTLILAAQQGFKRVMGVEFSPQLAAIARENIRCVGVTAEVLEMDACQFQPPDENLFIYLYNPFGDSVIAPVVKNLLLWSSKATKRLS